METGMRLPWRKKQIKTEQKNIIVDAKWLDILENAEPLGTSLGLPFTSDTFLSIIELISGNAGQIPWYAYRQNGEEIEELTEEQSIIARLLKSPVPAVGWAEFLKGILYQYFSTGNAFIRILSGSAKKYAELEILPSDFVDIINEQYIYRREGKTVQIPEEEIIHWKYFEQWKKYQKSPSPVRYVKNLIEADAEMAKWYRSMLKYGPNVPGVISVKRPLSQDEREFIREQFRKKYAGHENVGIPLIIEADSEYKPSPITPKDNQFIETQNFIRRRLCSVFGVASELLGDAENKTYSNVREARKALFSEVIIPKLSQLRDLFNAKLPAYFNEDVYVDFDTSELEIFHEDKEAQANRLQRLVSSGIISINEARDAMKYDQIPPGDQILIPASVIPFSIAGKEAGEKSKKLMSREFKSIWRLPDMREKKKDHFEWRAKDGERLFIEPVKGWLKKKWTEIIDVARKHPSPKYITGWDVVHSKKWGKDYAEELMPIYKKVFIRGFRSGVKITKGMLDAIEIKQDIFSDEYDEILYQMVVKSGTKISETIMSEVIELLERAQEENWTVEQFTQYIWERFRIFVPWEARRIARTEAAKTENFAELEAYKSQGAELKGWLSAKIETSRIEHIEADDKYSAEPIPLTEPFIVGGEELNHPGDPKGSPGNIINCLCTLFPAWRE
jgi:HK97 family phage portal protein